MVDSIVDSKPFDTNVFFSGGAGIFLEYHDVIKPVHLYAILQMILTNQSYGLPLNIIKDMSIVSIVEWYLRRKFKNPLKQLDINNQVDIDSLNALMNHILTEDPSIARICPTLNVGKMMDVYRHQHMNFPVYIYSEHEESYISEDCDRIFSGIPHKYFFGDLKSAISNCDQNFTYIFSDIETVKLSADVLTGTCSHVLLARDYRYNYIDNGKTFKYDLQELAESHPFIRIGTTLAMDVKEVISSYAKLIIQEDV